MTNRTATKTEIRADYRQRGYEVRISRKGVVSYRPDPDSQPGTQGTPWLFGGYVSQYRWIDGQLVAG